MTPLVHSIETDCTQSSLYQGTSRTLAGVLLVACGLALFAGTGCEMFRPRPKAKELTGPIEAKSAEQLVAYLNQQNGLLDSVRYPSLRLELVSGKDRQPSLESGNLICAKPRYFSLVAGKFVMSDIVQIGSNTEQFWLYSKYPEPTYVYSSHADLQTGVSKLPFPFDPDWALQALGMSYYDPNAMYRLETDSTRREHLLSYETTVPQGGTVQRVVVFAADDMEDARPQIRRHLILDASGQLLAQATIHEVVTLPATNKPQGYVQVPTNIVLEWPQQQFKMTMILKNPRINEPMSDGEQRSIFSMPTIPGVKPQNLANLRFHPGVFRGASPQPAGSSPGSPSGMRPLLWRR